MRCFYHTSRDAVAMCTRCGIALCRNCTFKYQPDGKVNCISCSKKLWKNPRFWATSIVRSPLSRDEKERGRKY